jgi:hypothetical protein
VEDEYRNKLTNQVLTWRFLREISFVDLVNFLGKPENPAERSKLFVFDGDPEEQARILLGTKEGKFKKKDVHFKPLTVAAPAATRPRNTSES